MPAFSIQDLLKLIAEEVSALEECDRRLWQMVLIPPTRWHQHPWGDDLGGFWVVGIIGQRVIWFNEIEGGFNVSRYFAYGTIEEYWCDQDELCHVMRKLRHEFETGEPSTKCEPIE